MQRIKITLDTIRSVIDFFAAISIFIISISFYLSWNKTWQVKHEPKVAESISLSSSLISLPPLIFSTLKVLMDTYENIGSWPTAVEYVLGDVNALFVIFVGVGWWVQGQRGKGFWKLLTQSLRNESHHLGDLAKALIHPAGAGKMADILARLALIDDKVEAKEKTFIETFAKTWGVEIDWDALAKTSVGDAKYAQLRHDVNEYLATTPPPEQALQLADILHKLAAADDAASHQEELIVSELTGTLERYGGKSGHVVYELHFVPQNNEQISALETAFPQFEKRALPSGTVFIEGHYFSPKYAELMQQQYASLNLYTAIQTISPVAS